MDREEALKLLTGGRDGVKEWNRYRASVEIVPDLHGADLRGAKLSAANLRQVKLASSRCQFVIIASLASSR